MNDRFQNNPQQPPKPFSSGDDYEDREVYLRKHDQGGIPWWIWLVIGVPLLGLVLAFICGLAAAFLVARSVSPPAAVPAAPAPSLPAAPRPDGK